MLNRVKQFELTPVLADGSLLDVTSCAPCMAAWIVQASAKFDAVGVLRPALAAPATGAAGAPSVIGFEDLMSAASVPRTQADALLADVLAIGAVSVAEVLPPDWAQLKSWAALRPLEKRRLLQQIVSLASA